MPTGVVQWLDPRTGDGRVMDRGRRYAVRVESIDAEARHPGARVHFDIDHDAAGDVACNVVLREGTRVSPRQRRFGDLVGARSRDTKIESWSVTSGGVRGAEQHPIRVAEAWAEYLAEGRLDDAARLYSPIASQHCGGGVAVGPDDIRRTLEQHPRFARGELPESVEGSGDTVRVRWSPDPEEVDSLESHLAIQHGEIVEQWTGETRVVGAIDPAGDDVGPIELSVEGSVSTADRSRGVDAIARVLANRSERTGHVSLRLEWLADPAQTPRARARVAVDVDGDLVRASVRAATMGEALDLLTDRLVERIRRRAEHRRTLRRRGPTSGPGEWRHGDAASASPLPPRPDRSQRAVVRRPTWSPEASTVDEAVFDLEVLDLEFLLYSDLASGQDAVVYRRSGGTYVVRLADVTTADHSTTGVAAVEFDAAAPPHISLEAARQHLDEAGEPWVFFIDSSTGRGSVVYRRDDGRDGLITPRSERAALVAD